MQTFCFNFFLVLVFFPEIKFASGLRNFGDLSLFSMIPVKLAVNNYVLIMIQVGVFRLQIWTIIKTNLKLLYSFLWPSG